MSTRKQLSTVHSAWVTDLCTALGLNALRINKLVLTMDCDTGLVMADVRMYVEEPDGVLPNLKLVERNLQIVELDDGR